MYLYFIRGKVHEQSPMTSAMVYYHNGSFQYGEELIYNNRFVLLFVVVVLTCHVHWCGPKTAAKTNNAENDGHKHTGPNTSNHSTAPVMNEKHGSHTCIVDLDTF